MAEYTRCYSTNVMGLIVQGLVLLIALSIWFFHSWYMLRLFENVRFFSHLSDFEREMTYRTEMGLYFSFYKTLVLSRTNLEGIQQLMQDNLTEFGHTINALQRFNLYPELILSAAYRLFKTVSKHFNWHDQVCWQVNRGSDLPPVESCEGIGNYHYFYVYGVFLLAGTVPASLFIGGISLSGSILGGILAAAAFMFNHGEATRVQWTPPLRESFGYPIFLIQMILLGNILKKGKPSSSHSLLIVLLTTTFCAFWQLSQFIIGAQLGILVLLFSLELIPVPLLTTLWVLFSIAFCLSALLLFGNSIMLNSLFLSSLIAIFVLIGVRPLLQRINLRPLFVLLHILLHISIAIGFKMILQLTFHLQDDNNVLDLLKAKLLPNYATFHTRLYTCAPEFDFIQFETIQKLTSTWLMPSSALAFCLWLVNFAWADILGGKWLWRDCLHRKEKPCPELIYHGLQLSCFLAMALLVMRLKLFATPQLCLFCAVLANNRLLASTFGRPLGILRIFLFGILLAGMAQQGRENVREQLEMKSEFNNPEQEKLFTWILTTTPKEAVFAGTMALMANVKLSTLRPIVNHPHYESEEIRNRTLRVYSMYSSRHSPLHGCSLLCFSSLENFFNIFIAP